MSAGVMGQKDWDEHIRPAEPGPPGVRMLQDYAATFTISLADLMKVKTDANDGESAQNTAKPENM